MPLTKQQLRTTNYKFEITVSHLTAPIRKYNHLVPNINFVPHLTESTATVIPICTVVHGLRPPIQAFTHNYLNVWHQLDEIPVHTCQWTSLGNKKKKASCLTKPSENINNTNDCPNQRNIKCEYLTIKHYTSINFSFIRALLYLKCNASLPYTNSSYVNHQEQLEVYISN